MSDSRLKYTVIERNLIRPSLYRLEQELVYLSPIREEFSGYKYEHSSDGLLVARPGFLWDGATGGIDTETIMRGSAVHDIYCKAIYNKKTGECKISSSHQAMADYLLKQICLEDGMCEARANYVYWFVRNFQRRSRRKQLEKGLILP